MNSDYRPQEKYCISLEGKTIYLFHELNTSVWEFKFTSTDAPRAIISIANPETALEFTRKLNQKISSEELFQFYLQAKAKGQIIETTNSTTINSFISKSFAFLDDRKTLKVTLENIQSLKFLVKTPNPTKVQKTTEINENELESIFEVRTENSIYHIGYTRSCNFSNWILVKEGQQFPIIKLLDPIGKQLIPVQTIKDPKKFLGKQAICTTKLPLFSKISSISSYSTLCILLNEDRKNKTKCFVYTSPLISINRL